MAEVFLCPYVMKVKGVYAAKPALFQLAVLLVFVLAGSILSSFLVMAPFYLSHGFSANIFLYPNMLRLLQLVSAVGTFLLPAIGIAWTCSEDPIAYLSVKKIPDVHVFMLVLLGMLLLSPAMNLAGLLNKQMELPAFMEPVESWMRAQEATAERLTNLLLAGDDVFTLLFNLLVMAVAAGITEEFIFRGALQRIIGRCTGNHHLIIWTAAFLFSSFHMQFFGFLPRLLLGAYFGYLLYWSKSIWIPVFAHFTNNAIAVVGMSDSDLRNNEFVSGEISDGHLLPFTVAASICLILFFFLNRHLQKQL